MDKLEMMHAFTQVVEEGGFSAAARKMNTGRSTVHKLVLALEKHLGVKLLQRTTRHVSPTSAGLAFYEKCLQILADVAEVELALTQLHQHPQGLMRINAPMTFGNKFIAPLVAEFMATYPDVQIQLTLEDRFVDPIAEGYDMVIRIAQRAQVPGLISDRIVEIKQSICGAPAYLKSHGRPQAPKELKEHCCLSYGYLTSGNQWEFDGPEGAEVVPVSGRFCCNNGDAIAQAAIRGLGIVQLPDFIVQPYIDAGQLEQILPEHSLKELHGWLLCPINRHLSTKVKLFKEMVQSQFMGH